MSNVVKKITNLSIWDAVVNDRIREFEELDKKYRDKCRELFCLVEENEKLKEKTEAACAKYRFACNELKEKDAQIKALNQQMEDLKQCISDIESSSCWKITKPIRALTDKVKGIK